jgi:peptidoglycan/xylan/chitin deacetylase (PgdA/CDA1 family)
VQIALTFDAEHPDRPHAPPGVAERILAILRTTAVPATFFLQGRWVEAYPHLAREIVDGDHRIGNHSFYHARLTQLSDEGLTADVVEAEQVIKAVTGADPKPWFRCPWGDCGDDSRIVRTLGDLGYRHVGWHVCAEEWEIARTPHEVEDSVVAGALAAGERAIILLHSWPASVPAALPAMIRRLREAGAEFATLDDLHPSGFHGYLPPPWKIRAEASSLILPSGKGRAANESA